MGKWRVVGGGVVKDENFTFHFTPKYNDDDNGFGIVEVELHYKNYKKFFLDEFQPNESSFVKSYSKAELLNALSKATLLQNSAMGLVARLGGMGYRDQLFVDSSTNLYPNYLSFDAIFFRNYGQLSQMIVGYMTNNTETYNNLVSIIENYDECWLEISCDYD